MRHRRKSSKASGEHGIAKERLTEIVRCMAERNNVAAQFSSDLIHCTAAETAAQIAAMVWLVFEKLQRWIVLNVCPIDASSGKIIAKRMDWREKLALLNRESLHGELNRRSFLKRDQSLK
jgi:hypothetical protein